MKKVYGIYYNKEDNTGYFVCYISGHFRYAKSILEYYNKFLDIPKGAYYDIRNTKITTKPFYRYEFFNLIRYKHKDIGSK